MTSQSTINYWLDVFAGWVEAREMPGPQNDEALQVISELKELVRKLEQAQNELLELRNTIKRVLP